MCQKQKYLWTAVQLPNLPVFNFLANYTEIEGQYCLEVTGTINILLALVEARILMLGANPKLTVSSFCLFYK